MHESLVCQVILWAREYCGNICSIFSGVCMLLLDGYKEKSYQFPINRPEQAWRFSFRVLFILIMGHKWGGHILQDCAVVSWVWGEYYIIMMSPYTIGVWIRAWCYSVIFVSVAYSLLFFTHHAMMMAEYNLDTYSEDLEGSVINSKTNPSTGDTSTDVNDTLMPVIGEIQGNEVDPYTVDVSKTIAMSKEKSLEDVSRAPHGKTHQQIAKQEMYQDGAYIMCLDASQHVQDEIDHYLEDQWHLPHSDKHRHRKEAMKNGYFLNKTRGQLTFH